VVRQVSPEDRRARLLRVTPQGQQLLVDVSQAVLTTQDRILRPLPQAQRQEFLRMLKVLVDANNEASRAPRSLE
jgi:DNA-binding MarR family transcriptional regulator